MTLSYIQIDYDIVDKVQALFDKYGIKFNYRKDIIEKLVKYAENNRGLADAYSNYDCISTSDKIYTISVADCKKWKRKLKSVGLHFSSEDDNLLYFRNGMVNSMNSIEPLKEALDSNAETLIVGKEVDWNYDDKYVHTLEDLEEKLANLDKTVNDYVTFFKSKTYDKYLCLLKQSVEKYEAEQKVYESSISKITKGLVKLLDIENEK